MRRRRLTDEEIVATLRRAEAGQQVVDVCREAGITDGTFSRWTAKYGGLEASELRRVKNREAENWRLKQIFADQALDIPVLKDVPAEKWGRRQDGGARQRTFPNRMGGVRHPQPRHPL